MIPCVGSESTNNHVSIWDLICEEYHGGVFVCHSLDEAENKLKEVCSSLSTNEETTEVRCLSSFLLIVMMIICHSMKSGLHNLL